MSLSNYPPGADGPNAPWNQPEPKTVDCEKCGGRGDVEVKTDSGLFVNDCPDCGGWGQVEIEEPEGGKDWDAIAKDDRLRDG